ncbi:MAG: methyl-accepting chemotaxis protein [Gemmatimonadales bacterium]
MNLGRFVALYSQALAWIGTALLAAVLVADPRWLGQVPEVFVLFGCAVALRGLSVPLSKYSYLTQTPLVGIAGSLLVGAPATALAVSAATLVTDSVWLRKPVRVAWINLGREIITIVAAYGVYATALDWLGMQGVPALNIELLPALAGYALAYFTFGRVLFYFSLIIRAKLEPAERLMIVRYEVIGYAATLLAATIFVSAVVAWSVGAWLLVGLVLTFLGLLLKQMIEEAISAEELNKIHAMEAVITANISLEDSFHRIERLANRLVDWGDFRIYRLHEGVMTLVHRSSRGRDTRGEPSQDTTALRQTVAARGETVVIDDVTRDRRVADAPLEVQSLVIVPLKFGDHVIGTLELEHHKKHSYRRQDILTITTFASQLATAVHITDLRRPLVETVDRMTRQLATIAQTAEALKTVASAVATSTGVIREGVRREEGEVSGGLEATESLAQVSRRVSDDGAGAARASTAASDVASRNRTQIREAIERLVALKLFVGESSTKVQQLGQMSRRITGFIASIRELADMTNLLALNAAIEAARAGKHGKGFGVVADEVRHLAEQSASAAAEAGDLVQDIHTQVGEVVEQMRRGQVNVGDVEELSSTALDALDAIVAATAEATAHAGRITAAAGEQHQAFARLRERINAVASIAGQNRTEADDVATRAVQAAEGLGDLERATRDLEQVATMLRDLTRGFANVA